MCIKYASLYYQALKEQARLTLLPLRQDLSLDDPVFYSRLNFKEITLAKGILNIQ